MTATLRRSAQAHTRSYCKGTQSELLQGRAAARRKVALLARTGRKQGARRALLIDAPPHGCAGTASHTHRRPVGIHGERAHAPARRAARAQTDRRPAEGNLHGCMRRRRCKQRPDTVQDATEPSVSGRGAHLLQELFPELGLVLLLRACAGFCAMKRLPPTCSHASALREARTVSTARAFSAHAHTRTLARRWPRAHRLQRAAPTPAARRCPCKRDHTCCSHRG